MIYDDLPIKHDEKTHSYVKWPEGNSTNKNWAPGRWWIFSGKFIVISRAGYPTKLWRYKTNQIMGFFMWQNLWNNGRWATATKHVWYGLGCVLMNHPHGFALCFLGAPDSTSCESVGQMHLVRDKTTTTWLLCGWAFKAPFQTLLLLGGTE